MKKQGQPNTIRRCRNAFFEETIKKNRHPLSALDFVELSLGVSSGLEKIKKRESSKATGLEARGEGRERGM